MLVLAYTNNISSLMENTICAIDIVGSIRMVIYYMYKLCMVNLGRLAYICGLRVTRQSSFINIYFVQINKSAHICSDRMFVYTSDGVIAWGYVLYVERV